MICRSFLLRKTLLLYFILLNLWAGHINAQNEQEVYDKLYDLYDKGYDQLMVNADSALYYSKEYLELSKTVGDTIEIADALFLLGTTQYYRNKLDSALDYTNEALTLYRFLNDSSSISAAYNMLGNIVSDQGYYLKGIEYYQKGIALDNLLDDQESQVISMVNIGLIFYEQENLKEAEYYFREVLKLCEELNLQEPLSNALNGLASIEIKEGNYLKARSLAERALANSLDLNDKLEVSSAYINLGVIASYEGDHEMAFEYSGKAIRLAEEYGDGYSTALYHKDLANIYLRSGALEKGLEVAQKAFLMASGEGSKYLNKEASLTLSKAYELNGEASMALDYYKLYTEINETIISFNVQEKIMEQENELRKRENQLLASHNQLNEAIIHRNKWMLIIAIVLLLLSITYIFTLTRSIRQKKIYSAVLETKNADIQNKQLEIDEQSTELIAKNLELEKLNRTKDKLFSILTHDLKQPFNQIIGVIDVIQRTDLDGAESTELLESLRQSTQHTSQSVENLLIWSKAQFVGIKVKETAIDLSQLINDLKRQTYESLKSKKLKVEIDINTDLYAWADHNQVEIVLRNLLVNAIKFSPYSGQIVITGGHKEDMVFVSIQDFGQGMDKSQVNQLLDFSENFSTPGTLNEKGTGLGILIVQDFLHANNGYLKIQSKSELGSTFTIYLPGFKD